jgi:uncharacterized membrane protein YhaH (DUF805 family)
VLFYAVAFVIGVRSDKTNDDLAGAVPALIGLVLLIWGSVELGFLRGTAGRNRFGPDPVQRETGLARCRTHRNRR